MGEMGGRVEQELHIIHKAHDAAAELGPQIVALAPHDAGPAHLQQQRADGLQVGGQGGDGVVAAAGETGHAVGGVRAGGEAAVVHAEFGRRLASAAGQQHGG